MNRWILALVLVPGLAQAQFEWPEGLAPIEDGRVLTADDLNARFEALAAFARGFPRCEAGQTLVADGDGGWACGPGVEAAVAAALQDLTAVAVPDAAGCPNNGTTVEFRLGEQVLGSAEVCYPPQQDLIAEDLTLTVCTDCADAAEPFFETIPDALAWLSPRRIAADATVTIAVALGEHRLDAPIHIRHPDGDRLQIIGGVRDEPRDTTLLFAADTHGVIVEHGRRLGLLGGLTLESEGGEVSGVTASEGAVIVLGAITISGFQDFSLAAASNSVIIHEEPEGPLLTTGRGPNGGGPILAAFGGHIRAPGSQMNGSSSNGFWARYGGSIQAGRADVNGSPTMCTGFYAETGGSILAERSSVDLNQGNECTHADGYRAETGGVINADRSLATEVGQTGYRAVTGGIVSARAAASIMAGEHGFAAYRHGTVDASNVEASNARAEMSAERGIRAATSGFVFAEAFRSTDNTHGGFLAETLGHIYTNLASSQEEDPAAEPERALNIGFTGPP